MSKALGEIELLLVFLREENTVPLAVGLAVLSQVNSHVINLALQASYQLALRVLLLEVQTSQYTLFGL